MYVRIWQSRAGKTEKPRSKVYWATGRKSKIQIEILLLTSPPFVGVKKFRFWQMQQWISVWPGDSIALSSSIHVRVCNINA